MSHGPMDPPAFIPTGLEIGTLGPDRSIQAWRFVREWYFSNPLPVEERCAFLCAAWERKDGRSATMHSTGMSLLGQEEGLIDLAAVWRRMSEDPAQRRVLRATMDLGQGKTVPARMLEDVHNTLGQWTGAWQDILALAGWFDLLHRANLTSAFVHSDPRLDEWIGRVVEAGRYLPGSYV